MCSINVNALQIEHWDICVKWMGMIKEKNYMSTLNN